MASRLDLVGRDTEIDSLRRVIKAALNERGQVLLVAGPVGIGKSALLACAGYLATEDGCAVLTSRGSSAEDPFAYAAAYDLVEAALRMATDPDQRSRWLSGPAQIVTGMTQAPRDSTPGVEDETALLQGFHRFLVNVSRDLPLVIAVDDAHLLDPGTRKLLDFVAPRIADIRVSMILAGPSIGANALPPDTHELSLEPVSAEATAQLVGKAGVPESLAYDIHEASGGVPLHALALIQHVLDEDCRDASCIRALIPGDVQRRLVSRAREAGTGPWELLQVAAVLTSPAGLRVIAGASGIEDDEAHEHVATLEALQFVAGTESGEIIVSDPILRAGVESALSSLDLAALHQRVGQALADDDAPAEHVADHALRSPIGHATWAVEALVSAASTSAARGAHEEAAEMLERAAREAPADQQTELQLKAALTRAMFDPAAALEVLTPLLRSGEAETLLPGAARHIADVFAAMGRPDQAVTRLEAALARLEPASLEHSRLLAVRRIYLLAAQRPDTRPDLAAGEGTPSDPAARGMRAAARTMELLHDNNPADEIRQLALDAWGFGGFLDVEPPTSPLVWSLLHALISCGEHAVADRGIDLVLSSSISSGLVSGEGLGLQLRAALAISRGDIRACQENAEQSLALLESAIPFAAPLSAALAMRAQLEAGQYREALARAEEWTSRLGRPLGSPAESLWVMASMAYAAAGQYPRADQLLSMLPLVRQYGIDSAGMIPRAPADVVVALGQGDHRRAEQAADRLVESTRKFGMPNPIAEALILKARTTSEPEGLLRDAIDVADDWSLPSARACLLLGRHLQAEADVDVARAMFGRALELSRELGATAIEGGASAGLRALGDRPVRYVRPGPARLTAGEKRVALLARDGMSNRAIAETLFVTVKAVEAHLTNVYRKLGIQTREDLRRVLEGS